MLLSGGEVGSVHWEYVCGLGHVDKRAPENTSKPLGLDGPETDSRRRQRSSG